MLRTIFSRLRPRRRAELGASVPWRGLRIHKMRSRVFRNTRLVRVWLPPGFDARDPRRYPVLYLNDGQNLFDPATAFAGVHWRVGETATRLIGESRIPPLIIVGIDNTGRAACENLFLTNRASLGCWIPRANAIQSSCAARSCL